MLGGTVLTVNRRQPPAEALAIRDGRILAVGGAAEVLALVSTWTQVSPFVVSGLDEVLARLRQAVAGAQPGDWVLGFGYDPSLTPPYEPLSFAMLDPLSATIPIFVLNLSGHLAYANSAAFAAAGVTNQTPDVPGGGRYIKDAAGQLAEFPAYAPFFAKAPPDRHRAECRSVHRACLPAHLNRSVPAEADSLITAPSASTAPAASPA